MVNNTQMWMVILVAFLFLFCLCVKVSQMEKRNALLTKVEKNPYVSLFKKRKENLEETCEKIKKNPREPFVNDPSQLFVLQDRGISWCPVFKAGSSTWLAFTLELSSKSEVRNCYNFFNLNLEIQYLSKLHEV